MRRVVPAIILTILGLLALATFKSTAPTSSHAAAGLKAAAPRAPASTVIRAMTTTLTRECRRLTVERGSSNS